MYFLFTILIGVMYLAIWVNSLIDKWWFNIAFLEVLFVSCVLIMIELLLIDLCTNVLNSKHLVSQVCKGKFLWLCLDLRLWLWLNKIFSWSTHRDLMCRWWWCLLFIGGEVSLDWYLTSVVLVLRLFKSTFQLGHSLLQILYLFLKLLYFFLVLLL